MIANLSTVLYVTSISEQSLSNKILQKGTAACKINSDGDFLNIQFTLWLPYNNNESSEDAEDAEEDYYVEKIYEDTICFVTGKFKMLNNGSLELVLSSCKSLLIEKEKMPVCKPIIYLLGKVKQTCNTTDLGYHLTLEVRPYLSSELCGPMDVVLTHPLDGRLKNTFTAAKKLSLIQCTGELLIVDGNIYCNVIEMQFVNTRSESISTSNNVPWATSNIDNQKKKNSTENRISAIHQSIQSQPPNSVKIKKEPGTEDKGKSPKNQIKINEIAGEVIKRKRGTPTIKPNKTDGEMSRKDDTLSSVEVVDISKSDDEEESTSQRRQPRRKTKKTES